MKIRIHTFMSDGQDGSATVRCYRTYKEAQDAEDQEMECCGQIFCEAVSQMIIDTDDFEEVV